MIFSFDLAAYWSGFLRYWKDLFGQQNGVALIVLAVGFVGFCILLIGKTKK